VSRQSALVKKCYLVHKSRIALAAARAKAKRDALRRCHGVDLIDVASDEMGNLAALRGRRE
jgi:hypothetical protein